MDEGHEAATLIVLLIVAPRTETFTVLQCVVRPVTILVVAVKSVSLSTALAPVTRALEHGLLPL
jgi:hypothetical protein